VIVNCSVLYQIPLKRRLEQCAAWTHWQRSWSKTGLITAKQQRQIKQRLIGQRAVRCAQSDDFQPDRPRLWANDTQASVLQTTPARCEAAPFHLMMARSAIF